MSGGGAQSDWCDWSMVLELGKGDAARFWVDRWLGEESLASKYPRLFSISNYKFEKVYNMGEWVEEAWIWKID